MKLKGFIPAPFTPFFPDGKVNVQIIPAYAERLKKDNVAGVFINGTTGEGLMLNNHERKITAEAWLEQKTDDFKVIIHTGATSIEDVKDLTRHAAEHSADGTGVMAPIFLRPNKISSLIQYCSEVAAEAPEIPFYYYHIPQITDVDFMMIDFLEGIDNHIPNFAGIKYSGTNIMDVLLCAQFDNNRWDVIYGQDEKLLAGLAFGLDSAIGSTYNYMTPHYQKLVEAYQSGNLNEARELQTASAKLVRCMDQFGGGIRVGKRIMKEIGIDCGSMRSPGPNLPETEWEEFQQYARASSLEEYETIFDFIKGDE